MSKDNRRCLRPKVPGSDYCICHSDPGCVKASTESSHGKKCTNISLKRKDRENGSDESPRRKKRKKIFKSIACLKDDVSSFFRGVCPHKMNLLNWNIQCVEDAFCSERNMPFALGLQVRRYFPGYGKLRLSQLHCFVFSNKCIHSSVLEMTTAPRLSRWKNNQH